MRNDLLQVAGVKCSSIASGIKKNNALDLSLITLPEGSETAAVFTQNVFCAAPVLLAKNHLQSDVRALLINSGNANAGTGEKGFEHAYQSCQIFADVLDLKPEQILPFSTGVIGQLLPLAPFQDNAEKLAERLSEESMNQVAEGILTTDLVDKCHSETFEFDGKIITLTGIAKGSGMIRPDMATMLSFIVTDICASQQQLQACLAQAVNQSFNRITVDGDTSTNDALTLSATNQADTKLSDCLESFQEALNKLTQDLAHKIVRDGEGATKFVEICASGLATNDDCLEVAYTVAHSPLVKTALFASDANWGRILAAVGRAKVSGLVIEDINIYLNELPIITAGEPDVNYTEEAGSAEMAKADIVICIEMGEAPTSESVWTTDFSYDYVKINAEYRS
ncbi:MAG TPA: bifunctional glutamate N-acetyltransferase/amino-acid acetyltransferase ArgJ [Candidatus Thioglobus sp.]|nr:bifunctional glutamate N-acetyltransferase/amino-acid acetyltransferase ArgJ [Candidatus Thioglobus sp.]